MSLSRSALRPGTRLLGLLASGLAMSVFAAQLTPMVTFATPASA